jgi:hypothetical protein
MLVKFSRNLKLHFNLSHFETANLLKSMNKPLKNQNLGAGGMAQLAECLPSTRSSLSSNCSTAKYEREI